MDFSGAWKGNSPFLASLLPSPVSQGVLLQLENISVAGSATSFILWSSLSYDLVPASWLQKMEKPRDIAH